jgi:uncharacterized protein (TIGR03382 family)
MTLVALPLIGEEISMLSPCPSSLVLVFRTLLVGMLAAACSHPAFAKKDEIKTLEGTESGDEGSRFSWTCEWGDNDEVIYSWDFGDGTTVTETLKDEASTVSHTYLNGDQEYEVSCAVETTDGEHDDDEELTVQVANVAPVALARGDASGDEGETLSWTCEASDDGINDTHTYTWDFGDGATASGPTASHAFDDDGTFAVTCTATDDDGGSGAETLSLSVANVAPALGASGDEVCVEGSTCNVQVVLDDPGIDDTHTWSANLPDGAVFDETSLVLSWSPTWQQLGESAADIVVTDNAGDSSALSWTFEVVLLDEDEDGLSDNWELENGLDSTDGGDATADPDGDGRTNADEFELGTDPQVNDGPSTPVVLTPADGSEVSEVGVVLVVVNAESPVGEDIWIRMALYSDKTMATLLAVSEDLAQGSEGMTAWKPWSELTENTWYYWWAVAEDSWTTGSWSAPSAFFFNAYNEAPTAPGLNTPFDGSTVDAIQIDLVLDPASDPDDDSLTYTVVLADATGQELTRAADLEAIDGAIVWPIDVALTEDALYCWHAWATDDEGLQGDVAEAACFQVDRNNEAPSAPTVLWPLVDDRVWSLTPEIQVADGVDPEGRSTEHIFELDWDPAFGSAERQIGTVLFGEEGITSWTPTVALADDTVWYLRVTCSDGATTSEQATTSFRVNSTNDAPSEPVLQNPAEGAHVADGDVFTVVNSTDPDEEVLAYEFRVTSMATGGVVLEGRVDEDPSGITSWVPERLDDDLYIWTARAVDPNDLASNWVSPRSFEVAFESSGSPEKAEPMSFWGCSSTGRSPVAGLGLLVMLAGLFRRRR